MSALPDFTGYEPIEFSQVKVGDVVAAVLDGSVIYGTVSYARPTTFEFPDGANFFSGGDYKLYRAPKGLPTGECAVIEWSKSGTSPADPLYRLRAILMGGKWYKFDVYDVRPEGVFWDTVTLLPTLTELQASTAHGFTTIFEGTK